MRRPSVKAKGLQLNHGSPWAHQPAYRQRGRAGKAWGFCIQARLHNWGNPTACRRLLRHVRSCDARTTLPPCPPFIWLAPCTATKTSAACAAAIPVSKSPISTWQAGQRRCTHATRFRGEPQGRQREGKRHGTSRHDGWGSSWQRCTRVCVGSAPVTPTSNAPPGMQRARGVRPRLWTATCCSVPPALPN